MYNYTLEDKPTVEIASDTDILILMVHVFACRLLGHDWLLQTKKTQFVNVSKIHDYIGNAVAITLPAMFVLTGCDTVSYFYRKSWASVRLPRAYPSRGDVRRKAEKIFQIFVYDMYVLMYVLIFYFWLYRSSLQRCSVKKGVLKKFAIFPGKHLCWSAFLRELHVRRPATLLKRDPNTGVFLLILRSS